jgi:hypothetical protein
LKQSESESETSESSASDSDGDRFVGSPPCSSQAKTPDNLGELIAVQSKCEGEKSDVLLKNAYSLHGKR